MDYQKDNSKEKIEKDPYKRYLFRKRITPEFTLPLNYERREHKVLLEVLDSHFKKFSYIYEKLNENEKIVLKQGEIGKLIAVKVYNLKFVNDEFKKQGYESAVIVQLSKYIDKLKNYNVNGNSTNDFYLVDLFKDKSQYKTITNLLVEKKIVTKKDCLLQLNNLLPPHRFISCIGYLLISNNYLEKKSTIKLNAKNLVSALNNTFSENISEATYSASKKQFIEAEDSYNHSAEIYLKALKFIK